METLQLESGICVRLEKDEEVVETLTAFLTSREIQAGMVSGIGAVKDVELGFYELAEKTYHRKRFAEDHELLSLLGNVSMVDDAPFLHAHVTLGDSAFRVHGGHLFRAVVAVTVELIVTPLPGSVRRAPDAGVGLNLWSLGACPVDE